MNSPANPRRRPSWPVPVLIGLVTAMAIALIVILQPSPDSPDPTTAAQSTETAPAEQPAEDRDESGVTDQAPTTVDRGEAPDLSDTERRDPDDPLAIGAVDAPVALVMFSDYQCPFCARWANETLPVLEPYVETGDLRIEFRDVNVFGEASVRGARAAYAAALQGEFMAMHDALFADGQARAATQLTDERLIALAQELGLDSAQFNEDYHAESTLAEVERNQQMGLDVGAFTTPAFILGGTPLVGAQPTEVFTAALDEALTTAGSEG